MMVKYFTCCIFILFLCCLLPVFPGDRIALVLGNSSYISNPLENPVYDARDMASILKQADFRVISLEDGNHETMLDKIREFEDLLKAETDDCVGLFYFSGHGVQVEGRNYLIPVNSNIKHENEISYMAIDADLILRKMQDVGNKINIIILDACRDNPFPGSNKSGRKGLAVVEVHPPGSIIIFATAPGCVAKTGTGRNSVFTQAFIKHMLTPGLDIELMMRDVREEVIDITDNVQIPWNLSSLPREGFKFVEIGQDPPKDWLILVEGGSFEMGSESGYDDEKPVHTVNVNSFYISKYEVTQEEYLEFCNNTKTNYPIWLEAGNMYNIDTGSDDFYTKFTGPGKEKHPIIGISWYDTAAYCNWLSRKEKLTPCYKGGDDMISFDFKANGYRLPTEAEWEYAAQGGNISKGDIYSGSNGAKEVAWYFDNSNNTTHAIALKQANELGLYDMSGNVYEWCWDWYGSYIVEYQKNPRGPETGTKRVLRGGCWSHHARSARSAYRYNFDPAGCDRIIGFRLVRNQ